MNLIEVEKIISERRNRIAKELEVCIQAEFHVRKSGLAELDWVLLLIREMFDRLKTDNVVIRELWKEIDGLSFNDRVKCWDILVQKALKDGNIQLTKELIGIARESLSTIDNTGSEGSNG